MPSGCVPAAAPREARLRVSRGYTDACWEAARKLAAIQEPAVRYGCHT